MPTNDSKSTGFRIADAPIVDKPAGSDFAELPRAFGAPMLFAIARDPRTLFVYWNVDWTSEFGVDEPKDRQVYLRVRKENGLEESESIIEPMLGSFYAPVATPGGVYRVELGYYARSAGWKPVALSDAVTMPPDSVSENVVVDVATVPFHLSFQKMIDLFCESKGDPLATVLSRVQERAIAEEDVDLSEEEREVLRAMNLSVNEMRSTREPFAERPDDKTLRKRAEAILGFGSTSPTGGFGDSTRS